MKRSTERTLTTHAGSLARPDDLRALLTAKDDGHPKIAWAKFEALVEGARLATKQLWGH
jgi:hypothetical protein